jgi:hypothetical protein
VGSSTVEERVDDALALPTRSTSACADGRCQLGRDWTIDELGRRVGLSRSPATWRRERAV